MKKIIVLITLLITSVSLVDGQDIDDARQLIESERYSSAEALLEKNIANTAPEPEVNYLLVKTYLGQDKTSEAGNYVNKHLQPALNSDADPLNRVTAARYFLNAGNKRAAEEIFRSVLDSRKNQKNVSLLLAMAEVAIEEEEGDAREALNWLDMAGKRDKYNAKIDIARGLAYRKLDDASNAFVSYQNAIKKEPSNIRAHYLLGKIFTAQKNPDVYLQHFMKAYEIDSTYAPVLEELYNHYYSRDVRTAKKYLEKYIVNTDYSLQNDYSLTDMFYLNGDYQDAILSANKLIKKEQTKVQPRLYKLIAYAYAKTGDSVQALQYMNDYFAKEAPSRVIAPDFQFIAQLTEKTDGREEAAITYYTIAVDMDTIAANKASYAIAIANLYKKKEDYSKQATWLGKLYQWKEKANNVDLFNWGLAYYMAKDFPMMDSVFALYSTRYPEDVYGYYWRAQANASIDTSMTESLAIPYYNKVVEIGELDKEKNKKMLLKAYGYLGGYEANIRKDYTAAIKWFERYLEIDKENAEISGYIGRLQKWMAEKK